MIEYRPITNKRGNWIGIGCVVAGEEDRGIQITRMFTHEKILIMAKRVEGLMLSKDLTKAEAIQRLVDDMAEYESLRP